MLGIQPIEWLVPGGVDSARERLAWCPVAWLVHFPSVCTTTGASESCCGEVVVRLFGASRHILYVAYLMRRGQRCDPLGEHMYWRVGCALAISAWQSGWRVADCRRSLCGSRL